jgi:hypothetical protein
MRDVGAAHHAAEDRAQLRAGKHFLCDYDEGVMDIVLWYGSCDAVQVSRSQVQWALNADYQRLHATFEEGGTDKSSLKEVLDI